MTKEALAAELNGREYGNEINCSDEADAKAARLVVIFGASDDLIELRGAIHDEMNAISGGRVLIGKDGCIQNEVEDDDVEVLDKYGLLPVMQAREAESTRIDAKWDAGNGYSWWIETTAPHAPFDVMEDGEKFCRGIVIDLKEICT